MRDSLRVLGVWFDGRGSWESHVVNRIQKSSARWRLMMKLVNREGRGASVEVLRRIYKGVVEQCLLYGMEVFWDGNKDMRDKLQKWMNRGMRWLLGAEVTTPVDVLLGELGWKRVEYMLDKRVERWGMRLWRRGVGWFGERWKEEAERVGFWSGGWFGRVLRGLNKNKLEGERWEVEMSREGRLGWKVVWAGSKEEGRRKWEEGRKEREEGWVVGIGDASEKGGRMGIGGGLWEGKELLDSWSLMGGWGMTVMEGEMGEVEEVLRRVLNDYKGDRRRLVVGTDNLGVVKRLNKGLGFCGEREGEVRRLGLRLLGSGWELKVVWVPGHVGLVENEMVDGWAKEGVWSEKEERLSGVVCWGKGE